MPKISLEFKLLTLGFALMALSSCQKTWQCECLMVTGGQQHVIIRKATENEAEEVCGLQAEEGINGAQATSCRLEGKYSGSKI